MAWHPYATTQTTADRFDWNAHVAETKTTANRHDSNTHPGRKKRTAPQDDYGDVPMPDVDLATTIGKSNGTSSKRLCAAKKSAVADNAATENIGQVAKNNLQSAFPPQNFPPASAFPPFALTPSPLARQPTFAELQTTVLELQGGLQQLQEEVKSMQKREKRQAALVSSLLEQNSELRNRLAMLEGNNFQHPDQQSAEMPGSDMELY